MLMISALLGVSVLGAVIAFTEEEPMETDSVSGDVSQDGDAETDADGTLAKAGNLLDDVAIEQVASEAPATKAIDASPSPLSDSVTTYEGAVLPETGAIEPSVQDMIAQWDEDLQDAENAVPTTEGTEADDTLVGSEQDDLVFGHAGNDEVLTGPGSDTVLGGSGEDIFVSGADGDSLFGQDGNDALHARDGHDFIHGGAGQDSLFGGDGDDTLYGGDDEEDYLIGGAGDDVLYTGSSDMAHGGAGADTFVLIDPVESEDAGQLMDFNSAEDTLMLYVDENEGPHDITLSPSQENPGMMELRYNGNVVATMPAENAVSPENVEVIYTGARLLSA